MLSTLAKTDWSALSHAHGMATDIPDYIAQMQSDDARTRWNARRKLRGEILHQGTIFEAAAYVVPVLVEMLNQESMPDKYGILDILRSLALGQKVLSLFYKDIWEFSQSSYEPTTEEERESANPYQQWEQSAHDAVYQHHEIYIKFLRSEEAKIRRAAAQVLGCFPEHHATLVPILRDYLVQESDEYALAEGCLALRYIAPDYDADIIGDLEAYLTSEQPYIVRFVAALGLCKVARERLSTQALDLLVNALPTIYTLHDRYRVGGDLPEDVMHSLCFVDKAALPVMPRLIQMLGHPPFENSSLSNPFQMQMILLHLTFGWKQAQELRKAETLSKIQRDVLDALVHFAKSRIRTDCEPIFNISVQHTLHIYGLPPTPKELAKFINQ